MAEHDEDEQETKGQGRHEEEVHGDDLPRMCDQKGPPRRRGPRGCPAHVLGDGQLGDVVSEESELRLDPPAAPRRILAGHPADQVAELGLELRTADRVRPGLPSPVELEALAVPGENRGGLNDDEARAPAGPHAGQPDPEDSIPPRQGRSANGPLENRELMAQCEVLEGDGRRPAERGAEERPETDHEEHGPPRHQA